MQEPCRVKVIVIDPGHGGKDPGAVCGALVEKQINWALANTVNDILNRTFVVDSRVVQPSATNPKSTSQAELTIPPMEANRLRADLFISFHVNAGGGTGFESFTKKSRRDHAMRKIIHTQIVNYLGPLGVVDRGMKFANFKVLRLAKVPAMLFEFLFIDNPGDQKFLLDREFMYGLANEVAYGISVGVSLERRV